MEGKFRRQRMNRFFNSLGLLSGIALAGLFCFLMVVDPPAHWDDAMAAGFFVVFGLIVSVFCGVGLYLSPKVFLRVDEDRVRGWSAHGGALDCSMADVDQVAWGGYGLNLTLKTGKRYNFMDLENANEIGSFIDSRVFIAPQVPLSRQALAEAILALGRKRKRQGIGSLVSLVMVFVQIFLAVFLIEAEELHDFAAADWQIFGSLACIGMIFFLLFFLLLRKWAKTSGEYERLLRAKPTN